MKIGTLLAYEGENPNPGQEPICRPLLVLFPLPGAWELGSVQERFLEQSHQGYGVSSALECQLSSRPHSWSHTQAGNCTA